jgi:hypothetical protein
VNLRVHVTAEARGYVYVEIDEKDYAAWHNDGSELSAESLRDYLRAGPEEREISEMVMRHEMQATHPFEMVTIEHVEVVE